MATPVKGDKVWLRANPQFYRPAGVAINGFYRNGAVPSDTITNERFPENYNDCTFLGEIKEVEGKYYYLIRLNFTYREHVTFFIARDVRSSEDLYFREEEISFEYIPTEADKKKAEQDVLKDKILNGGTPGTTGSGDDSGGGGNTWIVVAIVGVVVTLGGVLVWAFRKPSNPTPPPAPTIIQLKKSK